MLLEVRVVGPEVDWNRVAFALAGRVADLKWGTFFVREAAIDEAKEDENDDVAF